VIVMSNAFDFQATNVALALDVLFPTNVYSGSGVSVDKQGPNWTINLDVADLPENTSATPASNFYFPAWDTGTQRNEKVRLDNMVAVATGLDSRKAIGDANYNILTTDRYVAIASPLTANRLITLPPANSVPGGREVLIQDEIGTLGPTHYVTVQPTGADTIDGTQSRVLAIPYAGLRVRADGIGRWSYVNAFAVTKVADTNYTANPDDRVIDVTVLTAARVITLPAANAYPAGQRFTLYDQAGQCSAANTLRLAPAGTDLINGAASPAIATLNAPYGYIGVVSDGVSRWTVVDGGTINPATAGHIDNMIIGATVPAAATVTSMNGGQLAGLRNHIINGNFGIDQRGYTSGTALAAGVYGHDRWKAGASGCTYTFTVAIPDTLITITANTLTQVIEGANIEGGQMTLSWAGTAQARVYQGSPTGAYAASPVTVSGLAAGTNTTIEFNAGTLGAVQFETGPVSTPFERRGIGLETVLCQRYYQRFTPPGTNGIYLVGYVPGAGNGWYWQNYISPPMRSTPTGSIVGTWGLLNASAPVINAASPSAFSISTNGTAAGTVIIASPANGGFDLSAEL
jgi:hypothetical protein